MKVIDLLNKIAKGEEVPKKINWHDDEWEYSNGESKNYFTDYEDLFTAIDGSNLNDEVEIIGEKPKHIEKINKSYPIFNFDEKSFEAMKDMLQDVYSKQVKIIKSVNYLLDKEER